MSTAALIIPAAGSGSRLQRDIPKPYVELAGRSILGHTISRFLNQKRLLQVVVATSPEYIKKTRMILNSILPDEINSTVVEGGKKRQDSVYSALQAAEDVDLVMIHDAVRPFVTAGQIAACCAVAEEADGAVLGFPVTDTIKQVNTSRFILSTPSRKNLWKTQTPQVFKKEIIMEAYKKASADRFVGTDDSSLVERLGLSVKMVEGDYTNFKITYPLDLVIAKRLFEEERYNE